MYCSIVINSALSATKTLDVITVTSMGSLVFQGARILRGFGEGIEHILCMYLLNH